MRVREDARFVCERAREVHIDAGAAAAFAARLDRGAVEGAKEAPGYPLQFDARARVNFECVKALLAFGSGWRKELKAVGGRGANDTMTTGLFSLYLGDQIDARHLAALSLGDVGECFQLPINEERAIGSYAGVLSEIVEHPIRPFVNLVKSVLNDAGNILLNRGCADFYELICRELKPSDTNPVDAVRLVEMMRSVFPSFNDVSKYGDREVHILKKAQLLASQLKMAGEAGHIGFRVVNDESLTIFADNVIPCVLRHLGILKLVPPLADAIDSGKLLPTGGPEVELRMAAIEAVEQIAEISNLGRRELDMYLWSMGKKEGFRDKNRHSTQNTVFY